MWVFDDERVGLDKEPFVAGADTMIDTAVHLKGIPNAEAGFLMVFSAGPFPDADFDLEWLREEGGGNMYKAGLRSRVPCRKWKVGSARHRTCTTPMHRRSCKCNFGRRSSRYFFSTKSYTRT